MNKFLHTHFRHAFLIFVLSLSTWADIEIIDYTSTYIIQIHGKPAKIKEGTHRIIHFIDMTQYNIFLANIEDTMEISPHNNT